MEKQTSTQAERNKKWEAKNRERSNYLKGRTAAKSFIRNKATLEDIEDLENIIEERKKFLKNS